MESVKHTNEINRICVVYSITAQKTETKPIAEKGTKNLTGFVK